MKGFMVAVVRSAKGYTVMVLNSRSTIQTPRPAKPKSKRYCMEFLLLQENRFTFFIMNEVII